MINKYLKKFKAMTLVEALFALVIIAIIFTLLIASFNINVSRSDAIAKINVAQSTLSRAIILYQAENFCSGNLSQCNDFILNATDSEQVYARVFDSRLKIGQNCGILANLGCFADEYSSELENIPFMSIDNSTDYYKVRLQNGISLAFSVPENACSENICLNIIIDTNGPLPPNKLNKDLFVGTITNKQVIFDFEK